MQKNVLVISASPRRNGNSDLLCDAFIKGANEANNTCEKIFLRDKKSGTVLIVAIVKSIMDNARLKMI